jgi:hypothetical protein
MTEHRNEKGELHRTDGPAVEWPDGTREWWVDGKLHRVDGPASDWPNGYREWWVDGKKHRVDGPAVEWPDGRREWWVDGKLHSKWGRALGVDGPAVAKELREKNAVNKQLLEALKPFAERAAAYDPEDGDDDDYAWYTGRYIKIGDLRRARDAIAAAEKVDLRNSRG